MQYPGRGLGDHSYCRNPDRESNPWCFFRQNSGAIGWAYCDCHQGTTPDQPACDFYSDNKLLFYSPSLNYREIYDQNKTQQNIKRRSDGWRISISSLLLWVFFRRSSSGWQLVLRQWARRGLPERSVGGGVRLPLVRQRRQCGLQTAGPRVREKSEHTLSFGVDVSQLVLTADYFFFFSSRPDSEIGTALQHSQFGSGSGLFHYERLGCRGDENSVSKCRSRTFVTGDCSHGNEAAVVCAAPEGQCDFSQTRTFPLHTPERHRG